ncbi:HlyD family secretion protein [Pedobacter fastidiosus]|uniref:HlyD family efflux transporter periplasmic adaptor subunit n=1 Tax=Pedobacter fastidiosus TaxID=2765361 RepID=A0ABR7KWM3_9SPHI|nr:HlyD family efflux transporter periplasmic adaptor subunit [Pedobacter fastidiosus]MBC6112441.1 HlyD family efflux transporter periplasmic adaptor subunit [Pedobacter fastidiosus]
MENEQIDVAQNPNEVSETNKMHSLNVLHLGEAEARSEEVEEIITAVPTWILRWGITLIFAVLAGIVLLSALIEYPDVVKVNLKVNSLNSPKQVLAKQNGKLTALLVTDGQMVKENQPLAYFESTATPKDVLQLNAALRAFQGKISININEISRLPTGLNLGELQSSYQNFYQQYLQYQSTQKNGYYLNRMAFLEKDLKDISALKSQIYQQQKVQKLEYANQEEEYKAYQKLYKNKVISRSEFAQQENKYLASKYPLQQTETSILNNTSSYSAKEKELLDLKHTIAEEQAKFVQVLNQCITESDAWILQHVLSAPVAGKLSFAGIIQQNQNVMASQEIFIVNPGNSDFFGEVQIPQYNMGKIHKGESTLVKLRSYPFEQYGLIRGKLTYISDVAYRDSVFIAKVSFEHFENKDANRKIVLKNGMQADAEIITEESSLLQRFFRNITKVLHNGG